MNEVTKAEKGWLNDLFKITQLDKVKPEFEPGQPQPQPVLVIQSLT